MIRSAYDEPGPRCVECGGPGRSGRLATAPNGDLLCMDCHGSRLRWSPMAGWISRWPGPTPAPLPGEYAWSYETCAPCFESAAEQHEHTRGGCSVGACGACDYYRHVTAVDRAAAVFGNAKRRDARMTSVLEALAAHAVGDRLRALHLLAAIEFWPEEAHAALGIPYLHLAKVRSTTKPPSMDQDLYDSCTRIAEMFRLQAAWHDETKRAERRYTEFVGGW